MGQRVNFWTAVLAALAALLGAAIGAGASLIEHDHELDEQRASDSRDNRTRAYVAFLAAADRYAVATEAAIQRCGRQQQADCNLGGLQAARYDYQGAINDLYVYGSDAAVAAEGEVSRELPPSLTGLSGSLVLAPVDDDRFTIAYQEFLAVMCEELPAEPRTGC